MSDYTVSVPAVAHTSVALQSVGVELRDELTRLRREVDAVLTGHWHGAAATAFDRAWGEWHTGAAEVVAALDRMAELLDEAGRTYLWSDESGASRLHALNPALPGR